MLPDQDDIVLKQSVKLYNNLARCGNWLGRLKADLLVNPSPQITWDLEMLGDKAAMPKRNGTLRNAIVGTGFMIETAYVTRESISHFSQQRIAIAGVTLQAFFGKPDFQAHRFSSCSQTRICYK